VVKTLTLRSYDTKDAITVTGWIKSEYSLRMWCADRFSGYPLPSEEFDSLYKNKENGFCGMIAEEDGEKIGHFFVKDKGCGRFGLGLIIVDPSKRRRGYGRKMLEKAIGYAIESCHAKEITLSVFEENENAYSCYKKLGFTETGRFRDVFMLGKNFRYCEMVYVPPREK